MLQIITLEEKQKYHITSRSSKLSQKQRFLAAFVIMIEESFYLIARKGGNGNEYDSIDASPDALADASVDCRPTVGRLSADCRPTVDPRQPTVDRQSTDSRPTVDRQSTDSRLTVGQRVFHHLYLKRSRAVTCRWCVGIVSVAC